MVKAGLSSVRVFERAPVGSMILQPDGTILAVNAAWRNSLGYTEQQVLDGNVDAFVATEGFSFSSLARSCGDERYVESLPLKLRRSDGGQIDVLLNVDLTADLVYCIYIDITEKNRLEAEREQLVASLQRALNEIKILRGFLPICASCKRIRNDSGRWEQIETYIRDRSDVEFSHGICPECAARLYPEFTSGKSSNPAGGG